MDFFTYMIFYKIVSIDKELFLNKN